MEDREFKELPDLLTAVWIRAFEEKRFHDALLDGLASYLISRDIKDDEFEKAALVSIKGAVDCLLPSEKEDRCSFCGRRPPDVRLAAGPNVFICDSCVATLGETFSDGSKK